MNKLIFYKGLIHSKKLKLNKGFTLIELIIVVFILGILSAMVLPNTMKQAAKSREVEAKNNLGILSRAQQAYHFETTTFANSVSDLLSNAIIQTRYYSFPNPTIANNSLVKHQAIAIDPSTDLVKSYAVGVYFNSGAFAVAVCESASIGVNVNVPDNLTNSCTDGGIRIR